MNLVSSSSSSAIAVVLVVLVVGRQTTRADPPTLWLTKPCTLCTALPLVTYKAPMNVVPEDIGGSSFAKCPCDVKGGCRCVHFYLCLRGTVTGTGFGIVRKRDAAGSCSVKTEVCCPEASSSSRASVHEEPITAPEVHYPEHCGTRQQPSGANTGSSSWHAASSTYFGEFPWTVMIQGQDGEPLCSGALLTRSKVLTAAHCVYQINVEHLKVIVGDWDYNSSAEPLRSQKLQVKAKMVHDDDYDDLTLAHDVAMLVLDDTLQRSAATYGYVCVPRYSTTAFNTTGCLSTGWGKDDHSLDETRITTMKKMTWTSVQTSATTCWDLAKGTEMEKVYGAGRGQICARGKLQGEVCQNDVGSPLVCPSQKNPERYILVGLAYGTAQCGGRENREIFVSVTDHSSWIMKLLKTKPHQLVAQQQQRGIRGRRDRNTEADPRP